jgi:hypothetical protein
MVTYSSYLRLGEFLDLQTPASESEDHDEMLPFIRSTSCGSSRSSMRRTCYAGLSRGTSSL